MGQFLFAWIEANLDDQAVDGVDVFFNFRLVDTVVVFEKIFSFGY